MASRVFPTVTCAPRGVELWGRNDFVFVGRVSVPEDDSGLRQPQVVIPDRIVVVCPYRPVRPRAQ